ncbi:RHS repeat-associated core domain-containing protein [Planctomycetales bacterium ZRK34]|nr:RHS repeat-associated core domain-containing protein [Planctomycetales bacterium ZRK34]
MGRLAVSETFSNGSSTPDTSTTYTYDNRGLRVTETTSGGGGETKEYLFDLNNPTGYAQVLEEYLAGALSKTFTLGHDVLAQHDAANGNLTFLYDAHGSTRAVLNTLGAIVQSYAYTAYGTMLTSATLTGASAALTNILYSGEWTQPNGQQYLRARFYDPSSGRFNRLDPFAGNTSNPLSLHKYVYTQGNPIMGIDPSGEMSITFTLPSLLAWSFTVASLVAAVGVPAYHAVVSSRQILLLNEIRNNARSMAEAGIITIEQELEIRDKAYLATSALLGSVANAFADIALELASNFAYGMLFSSVAAVASASLTLASATLTDAGGVIIAVASIPVKHHTILKSALKSNVKQVLYRVPLGLHVGPFGLHSRLARSPFGYLFPRRGWPMVKILGEVGRQQWLDDLGEAYKWLELNYPEYKKIGGGIYNTYLRAVQDIGGVAGLKPI